MQDKIMVYKEGVGSQAGAHGMKDMKHDMEKKQEPGVDARRELEPSASSPARHRSDALV